MRCCLAACRQTRPTNLKQSFCAPQHASLRRSSSACRAGGQHRSPIHQCAPNPQGPGKAKRGLFGGLLNLKTPSADTRPPSAARGELPAPHTMLTPRQYQRELIDLVQDTNAIITLPTGSGKTLIAAEIIRSKLDALKQAGKMAVFLAPTNPLADQIQAVLQDQRTVSSQGAAQQPLKCQAFHGDTGSVSIGTWDAAKWQQKLRELDVVVLTPELLLHCLAHASLKLSQIGLLVFDEAHHCASDHPYAQLMEDFYHTSDVDSRPQIVGLTASPVGVEGLAVKKKKKSKGKGDGGEDGLQYGLQGRMNARLVTLTEQHRPEMQQTTPVPQNEFVDFNDQEPAWAGNTQLQQAASELEAASKDCLVPAKKASVILAQLQRQAVMAESGVLEGAADPGLTCFATGEGPSFGSMTALAKQVNGVRTCLGALGPWGAAAAAHLDLLSAVPDSAAGDGVGGAALEVAEEGGSGDDEALSASADEAAGEVAAGVGGMSDMELAKRMQDDDLGADAETLIKDLRASLGEIHTYLQDLSTLRPAMVSPADLAAAMQPTAAGAFSSMPPDQLAAAAPLLLRLVGKSSVLHVLTLLTELLVADPAARNSLLNHPDLQAAASRPALRSEGVMQHFSGQLLQQVPFRVLQAQIWPQLPAPCLWPSTMPPLLSPNIRKVAQHLATRQQQAGQGKDWAAIVFVEQKLTALVLYKLLCSCPDMRQHLRAGYLVGDTEGAGGTAELGMSHKSQRDMVSRFRSGESNVLVCTNIGSEGMDFRQCQMVVAYDPPPNVTLYIQSRGRARAEGSTYAWLRPKVQGRLQMEDKKDSLVREAATLEAHAAVVSAETRQLLQAHNGRPPLLRTAQEAHNPAHLVTEEGGVATMRLAQVLLAGYCARLPGTDSLYIPQAWYKTTGGQGAFRTTIFLPPGASQEPVVHGDYQHNSKAAKNAAALAAIWQVWREGKMTSCLFPSWRSNFHAQQLAAEVIPPFSYSKCLQAPLAPRSLTLQPPPQQQQTVTLHLHSFEVSQPSQQHNPQGDAVALLQLAVGSPTRSKAVPGGSGSGSGSSAGQHMSFGVLTWEQLPGAVPGGTPPGGSTVPLEFPAWVSLDQAEPSNVRVVHHGPVTLSAPELLTLMRYQHTLNNTINWSNKRLLGLKGADRQEQEQQTEVGQQFGGAFKPLKPATFNTKVGFTALADATAAHSAGGADAAAAAAAALQGAELCYLFAPLHQAATIDWQAVASLGRGLLPAAALLSGDPGSAAASPSNAAAAAMAAVPPSVTPQHVMESQLLQDRVLLAGHSSQLYCSKGAAADVTPATTKDFEWSECSSTEGGLSKRVKQSASSHAEYFSKRYGLQGVRPDLPMLEVSGSESGRHKAMQLVRNPLKPPQLQPGVKRAGSQQRPSDLTTAEAAAAACDFSAFLQHSDQDAAAAAEAEAEQQRRQAGRGWYQPYLPLELCWVLPLSAPAWRELQLLPAFMYRVDSLLRLQQAQQQLSTTMASTSRSSSGSWQGVLPPQLLMAALTAPGAREVFDMEGLEYLGDVVLKALTTSYLLHPEVNDPSTNEGELSVSKARIIRNVQLASKAQEPHLSLQQHLHLLPYQPELYTPTGYLPAESGEGLAPAATAAAAAAPVSLYAPAQAGSNPAGRVLSWQGEAQEVTVKGKRLADSVEALIGAVYLAGAAAAGGSSAATGTALGVGGVGGDHPPVSDAGLAASAAFCEAAGILPAGSAALACQPCLDAFAAPSSSTSSTQGSRAKHQPDLQQLQQQVLGHTFAHPSLLQQALRHVSHGGGCSYQRLEFLGDAVLDLVASSWLMLQLGQALQQQEAQEGGGSVAGVYAPGELTWRRAALVNNLNLARAAADAQLQRHLQARSGPLLRAVNRFAAKQQQQEPAGSQTMGQEVPVSTGGSRVPVLAAAAAVAQGAGAKGRGWGAEDDAIWQQVWLGKGNPDSAEESGEAEAEGDGELAAAAVKQHAPKALADIVESLVGAVLVDRSSGGGGGASRAGGESYDWAAAWQAVRRLLPGMGS